MFEGLPLGVAPPALLYSMPGMGGVSKKDEKSKGEAMMVRGGRLSGLWSMDYA